MKKVFMLPYFVPVVVSVVWAVFMAAAYRFFPADFLKLTEEGALIETVTHAGYVVLIAVLLMVCQDYKDKVMTWGMFLFLAMCAFLREQGIQHHLSRTDTTPFKSRFFLNPNNPLGEKIVFGLVLLIVAGAVLYLAVKYTKHLIVSFFKFNTVTWSVAVLCTIGVFTKIIDRYPSNYRKAHGYALSDDVYAWFQMIEESGEMLLPYIAALALVQYHFAQRDK